MLVGLQAFLLEDFHHIKVNATSSAHFMVTCSCENESRENLVAGQLSQFRVV